MIRFFKIIAFLEVISLLCLFFFAMPLKYLFENSIYIKPIGMSYDLLFIGYIIMVIILKSEENRTIKKIGILALASVIPSETFYVGKKYLRNA